MIKVPDIITEFILGSLVIILAFTCMKQCGHQPETHTEYTRHTVYIHDTVTHTLPPAATQVKHIIYTHDTLYKTLTVSQLDTLATRFYNRVVAERQYADSNIRLNIIDTISQNTVQGSHIDYTLLKPTEVINHTTVLQKGTPFKYGLGLVLVVGSKPDAMVQGWYGVKKRQYINLGYMPAHHALSVGYGWCW